MEEIVKELREIKNYLKRLVYLFEKYDTEIFQDEEIQRDLQNQKPPRRKS
jgi:hypothetical protein